MTLKEEQEQFAKALNDLKQVFVAALLEPLAAQLNRFAVWLERRKR